MNSHNKNGNVALIKITCIISYCLKPYRNFICEDCFFCSSGNRLMQKAKERSRKDMTNSSYTETNRKLQAQVLEEFYAEIITSTRST